MDDNSNASEEQNVEVTELKVVARSIPIKKLRARRRRMQKLGLTEIVGGAASARNSAAAPQARTSAGGNFRTSGGMDEDSKSDAGGEVHKDGPVDAEGKAIEINLVSFRRYHTMQLYMATLSFFTCNLVAFTIPVLSPHISKQLKMTPTDKQNAAVAAACGNVFARLLSGLLVVLYGPRMATAFNMFSPLIAVFCLSTVKNVTGLLALRFVISFLQGSMVTSQVWVAMLYSQNCVGYATALSGGVGHVGGVWSTLVFSAIYDSLDRSLGQGEAWKRIPPILGALLIVTGAIVLYFTDDRRIRFEEKGTSLVNMYYSGLFNYRTFILAVAYGFSIGSIFSIIDKLPAYIHKTFKNEYNSWHSQVIVAMFQFMYLVRPAGGYISDVASHSFGIGGRVWNVFVPQVIGGFFMVLIGYSTKSAPTTVGACFMVFAFLSWSCGGLIALSLFVSARSMGPIIGVIGAGGAAGTAICNELFFKGTAPFAEGVKGVGSLTIAMAIPVLALYWPAWGGGFMKRLGRSTEEEYFLADYSVMEIRRGLAGKTAEFAAEARTQRGIRRAELYEMDLAEALERARLERLSEDGSDDDPEFDEPNPAIENNGVAIVTGSNTGIGFECARALCALGFITVATARRKDVGQAAVDKILAEDPALRRCVFHPLDIQDAASAVKLAEFIKQEYGGCDILVNNAGYASKTTTLEYAEAKTTMDINYGGTKAVTEALLPVMRHGGRIINVTSRIGMLRIVPSDTVRRWLSIAWSVKELDQLKDKFLAAIQSNEWRSAGWPGNMYAFSKLMQNLYTRVLARQLSDTDHRNIMVFSVCPGLVATNMQAEGKSPEEGADCQVWLASASAHRLKNGAFYGERRELSYA